MSSVPVILTAFALGGPVKAEVVIRGGTVYDGTGAAGVNADVAIAGGRILAVSDPAGGAAIGAPVVIDAAGLVVVPGFIDLHTHSDQTLTDPRAADNRSSLAQGVTTVVTGNCGSGPVDVRDYFSTLGRHGVGTNVIHLVPHGSLRRHVVGTADRGPTPAERKTMLRLVDHGMRDGAWGLSTGLIYPPGAFARTEELVELGRVVGRHGGLYATHIRDEGGEVLTALNEALTIGREAHVRVHVSHLKAAGPRGWGHAADVIALIDRARARGDEITADQYPYDASSTTLAATLIPARFRAGGPADYRARLREVGEDSPLVRAVEARLAEVGASRIRLAVYQPHPEWQGRDVDAIARDRHTTPVKLVLDIERHGGAQVIHFNMRDEDVRLIMKQPWVATASDGSATVPGPTLPHPRAYGCFARKIGRLAIQERLLPVEQAVFSATGLPASVLRVKDRGLLKPGMAADVVVLDPRTYRDQATYEQPHRYAVGVKYVFVNGRLAIEDGRFLGVLAGRTLRRAED